MTQRDTTHHRLAMLTDAQVMELRRAYRAGGVLIRELADRYHIHPNTARQIIMGLTYRHLPVLGYPDTPNKKGPRPGTTYGPRSADRNDAMERSAARKATRKPLPARDKLSVSQPPRPQFPPPATPPEAPSTPWEERATPARIEPIPDPTHYTGLRARLAAKRREERRSA